MAKGLYMYINVDQYKVSSCVIPFYIQEGEVWHVWPKESEWVVFLMTRPA